MNKFGKSLLLASLTIGAMYADTQTNKTFLATRPSGVNLAMEGTTWHTQINKSEGNEDKIGASIQVVGFYQENDNNSKLGKYFGFDDDNSLVIGNAGDTGVQIDKRNLLHDHADIRGGADDPFSGTINLSMKHKAAGVRIDYQQDLDGLVHGLYFKVRAPIIWTEHQANLGLSNSTSATVDASALSGTYDGVQSTTVTIADYFSGSLTQSVGVEYSDQQAVLAYAKIDSAKHEETCLADIDILLGWNFWETQDNHAGINIGLTIPTTSAPDAVYVFEEQCGNRGHWALGAGLDAKIKTWKHKKHSFETETVIDWRYLFSDTERRTLGLKGEEWGQYFLLGESTVKGVFPAANITTQNVDVHPGNQVDARFGFAYRYGGMTLDGGYNLYARESERVKTKETLTADMYGVAGNDYNSGDRTLNTFTTPNIPAGHRAFDNTDIAQPDGTIAATSARAAVATPWLTQGDLDVLPAQTPTYVSHKIYGGLGYAWNNWDTPLMLGVGGAYEIASDQKALQMWSLWGKLSITF